MGKRFGLLNLLVVVTLLFTVVLSGCGSSNQSQTAATGNQTSNASTAGTSAPDSNKPDISKHVDLTMYLLGDKAKDYDAMLVELNKKIQTDLNATLKINWIGWGDYLTKYPLVLASGEPIDLIYTAYWSYFAQEATKGAFKPLDDLIPQYMPQTWQEEPKDAWKQATVNGKIYCVPENYDELSTYGNFVRGDLMKKYGITAIKTTADLDKYLVDVAKNEKGIAAWDGTATDVNLSYGVNGDSPTSTWQYIINTDSPPPIAYDVDGSAVKLFDTVENPSMKVFYDRMYNLAQQGVFSRSVLSNKVSSIDNFANGKAAMCVNNLLQFNQTYLQLSKTHPDWDIQYINAYKYGSITEYTNNAMAIPTSAPNTERALMLLEKLRNDQTYFDFTTYGIPGKDFEITANNQIKSLDPDAFGPDSSCPWGWRNTKFYLDNDGSWPGLVEMRNWYESNIKQPQLTGFSLNDENVKTELSNINNLVIQYGAPLTYGQVDPAKYLPLYIQKLKEAGIDKVVQEAQTQADAYLKNQ